MIMQSGLAEGQKFKILHYVIKKDTDRVAQNFENSYHAFIKRFECLCLSICNNKVSISSEKFGK